MSEEVTRDESSYAQFTKLVTKFQSTVMHFEVWTKLGKCKNLFTLVSRV